MWNIHTSHQQLLRNWSSPCTIKNTVAPVHPACYLNIPTSYLLSPHPPPNMCQFQYWERSTCKHKWLLLTLSCGPKKNLLSCPMFQAGARNSWDGKGPKFNKAPAGSCPSCDLEGEYPRELIRMVTAGPKYGVELDVPTKKDSRVVVLWCCVM